MIDCFQFLNELDVLEIRLKTLAPYVDRFILGECSKTHSGKDKPFFYEENKERFKQFNITRVEIPPFEGNSFEVEGFGRKCVLDAVKEGDHNEIILISDVDEIPDLSSYRGEEGVFEHDMYCYYLNCKFPKKWRGTFAKKRKNLDDTVIDPSLRFKEKPKLPVVGGGWHFTSMGDYKYKLSAFAHQEINTEQWMNKIEESIKKLNPSEVPECARGYTHLCL